MVKIQEKWKICSKIGTNAPNGDKNYHFGPKMKKSNKSRYYSISNKKSYSILEVAKMFNTKTLFLNPRSGERYASALTKIAHNNKIIQKFGRLQLKDYISSFIKSHKL